MSTFWICFWLALIYFAQPNYSERDRQLERIARTLEKMLNDNKGGA